MILKHDIDENLVKTTADLWDKFKVLYHLNNAFIDLKYKKIIYSLQREDMMIIVNQKLSIPIMQFFSVATNQIIRFSEGDLTIRLVEKQLLMKHSQYFKSLWTNGFLESQPNSIAILKDTPKDHFELLLAFMKGLKITSFINLNIEELQSLLETAHSLAMQLVVEVLEKIILNNIRQQYQQADFFKQACYLLSFSKKMNLNELAKELKEYIDNYYFDNFEFDELIEYLILNKELELNDISHLCEKVAIQKIRYWPYREHFLKKACGLLNSTALSSKILCEKLNSYISDYMASDFKQNKLNFKKHMQLFYKNLDKIEFSMQQLTSEDLFEFRECKNLKKLVLYTVELSDLQGLKDLNSLECLDLNGTDISNISNWSDILISLTKLRNITLFRLSLDSSHNHILQSLTNLKKVYLPECTIKNLRIPDYVQELMLGSTNLSIEFIEILKTHPNLQKLSLWCATYSLEMLKELKNLPNLKALNITGCRKVIEHLEILKEFNGLEELSILESDSMDNANDFTALEEFKKLKHLNIDKNLHNDPIMKRLEEKGIKITSNMGPEFNWKDKEPL